MSVVWQDCGETQSGSHALQNTNETYVAVAGGTDVNGEPLYVGRGQHENGEWIPGKIPRSHNGCYISYGGNEIMCHNCQVLTVSESTRNRLQWIPASNGQIPHGAIPGGTASDGATYYIGRAEHEGRLTPGKVHVHNQCLFLPFDGSEHQYSNYEVLCAQ
ncbi:unnamed protein product [Didymodactylos carnosus]|uniref:Uncharacterized protein n=1 Tax=Didymodactylos carnosus TaxID=1234261 RepID=A0A816DXY1_9BILA|nr:unnamed protein product [Didymodactylos carnosus]CAF1640199.1 unnamed protein product [Didymodactylos carnosus]CAF3869311.1 unnamed protein product [Didymodactylos carnosus]CAF4550957.1 unnamed protein product [Didymodactylos carnosus]